jgi:signal transduction histidine kinase
MNHTNIPIQRSKSADIAFVVVVVSGYVAYLTSRMPFFVINELLISIGLGMVYLAFGLWASRQAEKRPSLKVRLALLVVQLVLGGLIGYITMGSAWLVLLPMVGYAFQYLPRAWALAACAVIWVEQMTPMGVTFGWQNMLPWGFALLAAVVFVAVFTQLMVSEQKARIELAEAHLKLQQYTTKAEELATVQERNRLAREIHDGLGHYLTAINIQIKAARALVEQNPPMAATALADAQKMTEDALADVRRSVSALRADPSSSRPLAEAIQALCEETRKAGVAVHFNLAGEARPLSPQADLALYRAAQEGLTNARKHARASQIHVRLEYSLNTVRMSIQDDGAGSADPAGGFGLTGLRERLELLGGDLAVTTAPGKGFTLAATLPMETRPAGESVNEQAFD